PRPRNCFIVFRSAFARARKGMGKQPKLSQTAGQVWNAMSSAQRRPYEKQAEVERRDHFLKYPGFRY
ncbi:hypothetical protein B0H16DRAFT_1277381, partial [Mycena metata]